MTKAMLLSLFLAVTATAAPPVKPRTAQEVAQMRADWMVRHNYRWHAPAYVGNVWRYARFEGAGFGGGRSVHHRMGTCLPRRRMRLIADAYANNGRFSVRVRLWK